MKFAAEHRPIPHWPGPSFAWVARELRFTVKFGSRWRPVRFAFFLVLSAAGLASVVYSGRLASSSPAWWVPPLLWLGGILTLLAGLIGTSMSISSAQLSRVARWVAKGAAPY